MSCRKEISKLSTMILPRFQACINRNPFLLYVVISREHLNDPLCQGHILQHLLQTSIIESGLWLIRENLKGTLFEENHCNPAPLKVPIYSTNQLQ